MGAGEDDTIQEAQRLLCGVLAASLFHFGEIKINDLKDYLAGEGIPVRRTS